MDRGQFEAVVDAFYSKEFNNILEGFCDDDEMWMSIWEGFRYLKRSRKVWSHNLPALTISGRPSAVGDFYLIEINGETFSLEVDMFDCLILNPVKVGMNYELTFIQKYVPKLDDDNGILCKRLANEVKARLLLNLGKYKVLRWKRPYKLHALNRRLKGSPMTVERVDIFPQRRYLRIYYESLGSFIASFDPSSLKVNKLTPTLIASDITVDAANDRVSEKYRNFWLKGVSGEPL